MTDNGFEPVNVPQLFFNHLVKSTVYARITANESGIIAGLTRLEEQAKTLGLNPTFYVAPGSKIEPGSVIAAFSGSPVQITHGEDVLLGTISKPSGVASAAHIAVEKAGRIRVACGGWKKMPVSFKEELRDAILMGGAAVRLVPGPFLYLDKNYIRISGSITRALQDARKLPGRTIIVQIRGETAPIVEETVTAVEGGAQVLMVDTGSLRDLRETASILQQKCYRDHVTIAFSGNINLDDLARLQNEDLDIVDIGRAILDAPLLDFRYDVFDVKE